MQLTITLSENVYLRAERFAKLAGKPVGEVIASVLESGLPLPDREFPDFDNISDSEVTKLTRVKMDAKRSQKLSDLLYDQQAGALTATGRAELDILMSEYNYLLLVHANANAEAVKRGLMPKQKP